MIKRIVSLLLVIILVVPIFPAYAAAPMQIQMSGDLSAEEIPGWYVIVKSDGADYVTKAYIYGTGNNREIGTKLINKDGKERFYRMAYSDARDMVDSGRAYVTSKGSVVQHGVIFTKNKPSVVGAQIPYQADKGTVDVSSEDTSSESPANYALVLRDVANMQGIDVDNTYVMKSATGTKSYTIGDALYTMIKENKDIKPEDLTNAQLSTTEPIDQVGRSEECRQERSS